MKFFDVCSRFLRLESCGVKLKPIAIGHVALGNWRPQKIVGRVVGTYYRIYSSFDLRCIVFGWRDFDVNIESKEMCSDQGQDWRTWGSILVPRNSPNDEHGSFGENWNKEQDVSRWVRMEFRNPLDPTPWQPKQTKPFNDTQSVLRSQPWQGPRRCLSAIICSDTTQRQQTSNIKHVWTLPAVAKLQQRR